MKEDEQAVNGTTVNLTPGESLGIAIFRDMEDKGVTMAEARKALEVVGELLDGYTKWQKVSGEAQDKPLSKWRGLDTNNIDVAAFMHFGYEPDWYGLTILPGSLENRPGIIDEKFEGMKSLVSAMSTNGRKVRVTIDYDADYPRILFQCWNTPK